MGADRRAPLLFLLTLALFSAAASARYLQRGSSSGKVSLALYYETLCPYCSNFIVNYLHKLFEDDQLMDIVDLKLVPYGNAKISQNGTVVCQHGKWECVLNKVEACSIDALPSPKKQFDFIYCVEDFVYKYQYSEWAQCFNKVGVDPKPIMDCYNSQRGEELILKYAAETGALQPPHKYVPWVTVNGKPLYDDYQNFLAYICKAYKGSNPPGTCAGISLKNPARTGGNSELDTSPREADTSSINTKLATSAI
uniref:Gamma-interferon-inducible lysosomal thiol reductase n=1 Tax=Kalanchoe fedtschenkoi TaxID=63787 RepID=A0A7N0VIC0_KALFE